MFPHGKPAPRNGHSVSLALSEVHRILGVTLDKEGITASAVEELLTALGCKLTSHSAQAPAWQVTLPSWRLDLEREIDLIEEVARVYGYNRFANTLPAFGEGVKALPMGRELRPPCAAPCSPQDFTKQSPAPSAPPLKPLLPRRMPGQVVPLGNPLSEEAGVLRPSLVPGTARMPLPATCIVTSSDVRLFELGTVFSGTTEKVDERPALGFAAVGALPRAERAPCFAHDRLPRHKRRRRTVTCPLSDARRLLRPLSAGCWPYTSLASSLPRRARRCRRPHGRAGSASCIRIEAAARKLKDPVLIGELYLDRLYKLPLRKPAARDISRFQPVRRDFSLVLDQSIEWERIDQALAALQIPELVEWRVREVFRDARLGAQEYSLLLGTTFQAPDRTLREEELQSFQSRVVEAVSTTGARLRT